MRESYSKPKRASELILGQRLDFETSLIERSCTEQLRWGRPPFFAKRVKKEGITLAIAAWQNAGVQLPPWINASGIARTHLPSSRNRGSGSNQKAQLIQAHRLRNSRAPQ